MSRLVLAIADRINARQAANWFCMVTAVSIFAWWALLIRVPESHAWFFPESMTELGKMSFVIADLLAAVGLIVCAIGLKCHWPGMGTLMLFITGGLAYATLYCIAMSINTGEGWIGTAAMSGCTGLLLAFCTIVGNDEPTGFRTSQPRSTAAILLRTFVQIVIFWSICLWLVPMGIADLERRLGMPQFELPAANIWGPIAFILASALGLSSAWTMCTIGQGTPLPTDCAPKLVQRGVYRYLRNPMATAGITQGIIVGLMLGSPAMLAASALGGLFWHVGIRPVEERDMLQRFGEEYATYRTTVGLWIPWRRG